MSSALEDQAIEVIRRPGPLRVERPDRRVRAFFADTVIADSARPLLVLEDKHLPVYYFPLEDVRMDVVESTDKRTRSDVKGEASYWTVRVGDRESRNAMWAYRDPAPGAEELGAHAAFYWDRMDSWFEEDDEVFAHPRDPYHRVDVLHSSRHVRVVLGGETVAETRRPRLLYETRLPTRYYIPKLDVRVELLRPSDTATRCPYKGRASYWDAVVGDRSFPDIAWSYPEPIPECPKIENHLCFFNEGADIHVDGELIPRPLTHWSRWAGRVPRASAAAGEP